jgi:HK97 family phage portal protein
MGLLTRLRSPDRYRSTYAPWDDFWYKPQPSTYGTGLAADVSAETALRLSMVWRCVRASSYDMASLSILLYKQLDRGKERATTHPLYNILHLAPNAWMTPFLFEQLAQVHILLRGMFYARIVEDVFGVVTALIPMNPDRVKPQLLPSGRLGFTHRKTDGGTEVLTQEQVHYRTGLTLDGIRGMSCIEASAPTLARALAAEGYATEFFTGGAAPPFFLSHPLTLGEAAAENLRQSIAKYKAGDKYLILEEAMEAKALGVSARDAQLLEVQQHNDEQVAGIFGMPGHRVGIMKPGSVSYASVENADLAYVKYVVGAQAKANEEAMTRDLLSAREQNRYVIEYLLESLLRGDTAARSAFYTALGGLEAITPNEIRERENMNPLPGGDTVVKNVPKAQPQPNTPRDPMGRPEGRSEARARAITIEAAARVVAKEIAAATRAGKKFASDPDGWQAWCREFYDDHAGFIGHVLKLSSQEARTYAEQQRLALETSGIPVIADWETRVVPQLAALALGEANGHHAVQD